MLLVAALSKPPILLEEAGRARVVVEAAVGEILRDGQQAVVTASRMSHAEDQAEDHLVEAEAEAVAAVVHHRWDMLMPVAAVQPEMAGKVVLVEDGAVKEEAVLVVEEDHQTIRMICTADGQTMRTTETMIVVVHGKQALRRIGPALTYGKVNACRMR
jgi:hypothetical protein